MKITVDVDCTPEEARRFLGLPDLTPVHEAYVGRMTEAVRAGGISPDLLESIAKSWAPMGETGMELWRGVIDQMTGSAKKA